MDRHSISSVRLPDLHFRTGHEKGTKLRVRAAERKRIESGDRAPLRGESVGKVRSLAVHGSGKSAKGDSIIGDGVFDRGEGSQLKRKQIGRFLGQLVLDVLEIGEFPKITVYNGSRTPAHEHLVLVPDDVGDKTT